MPNPITEKSHRHETLLQIFLPFFGSLLLLIGLAYLFGKATSFNTAQGAQIALVGLILPTLLFGLIFLVVTIGLIVGVTKLLRIIPPYARSVQDFFTLLAHQTQRVADSSVEPIMRVQEWLAIWQRIRRGRLH
ncbi:MAG: hypothetical protein Kow0088_13640 [Anaerolineales bacterium]